MSTLSWVLGEVLPVKYCFACNIHMQFDGDRCPGCSRPLRLDYVDKAETRVYLVRKRARYTRGFSYCCVCRVYVWADGGVNRCPFCNKVLRHNPRRLDGKGVKPRIHFIYIEDEKSPRLSTC
ncbi:MAG: hypothetical protein QW420_04725 [Candidatus Caldarchaeum sp.]